MKNYHIQASNLSGTTVLPSSKSQSLRAVLFASLAQGTSMIENALPSPDIAAMISACRQLGAFIKQQGNRYIITGVNGKPRTPDDVIDAGNSGQVLRYIACVAGLQHQYIVITGDRSIRHNRPVQPLIEALTQLGMICVSMRGDDHAPLIIKGPFNGNSTTLGGEDSQPVTGLLIASAFREQTMTIKVRNAGEKPWIELTLSWLDRLRIACHHHDFTEYQITGRANVPAFHYRIPGDLSSLAYPLVAALVTKSEITINNVDMTEPQGDKAIVEVLKNMGANIRINQQHKTLTVHKTKMLQGMEIDANDFVDCVTILAVVGCFALGTTIITGVGIARMKESDRITAITCELKKMGADIEEQPDGLIIRSAPLHAAVVNSHHDHRIAMSLAVAALAIEGETTIRHIDCVQKSFPNFVDAMRSLGARIAIDAE